MDEEVVVEMRAGGAAMVLSMNWVAEVAAALLCE